MMKAMLIDKIANFAEFPNPLKLVEVPEPKPGEGEVLLQVLTCGVCHTELDEIEGRTPPPVLPIIPGHQVVGRVIACGKNARMYSTGTRLGVGWIYSACGECIYCKRGEENLCARFRATGRDVNGGYAEYMTVHENFAFPIPEVFSDAEAAPLLCAGAIGYRSLRLSGLRDGANLGLTGFGASAHLVLKMALYQYPHSKVYVFSRSPGEREFALQLGAVWAGEIGESSPDALDAIIDTTPVWKPVIAALENLAPGGRLVINAIRKEDIDRDYLLKMDYPRHLWLEKEIKSVANVARRDIAEFLELAAQIPIRSEVQEFDLKDANKALQELKGRKIRGAKVLRIV
jgi:propanol-preferring alcohol dehydrogenase